MLTVSMKYFKDHIPDSVFDNQEKLAEALAEKRKRAIVESEEISPLTVRLFSIKIGLEEIEKCVTRFVPRTFPDIFVQQGWYAGHSETFELFPTIAYSGSITLEQSYLTNQNDWTQNPFMNPLPNDYRIEPANNGQVRVLNGNTKTNTFHLHKGIYDFFTNIDSSLDRIRMELNSIYIDGDKQLDSSKSKGNRYWWCYLDNNNSVVKLMVEKGYNKIVSILTGCISKSLDQRTSKYRNRLIHDGDLEINIDKSTGKVFLPDDPLATPISFNTELLPYLKLIFSDLQELLRQIYAQVIIDVNLKETLPLV